MIEVDPIEVVMRARKKCPGYVGSWTVEALEEKRRMTAETNKNEQEIRRLQKETEEIKK